MPTAFIGGFQRNRPRFTTVTAYKLMFRTFYPVGHKRVNFVCNFIENQQILMPFSPKLDFKMNGA